MYHCFTHILATRHERRKEPFQTSAANGTHIERGEYVFCTFQRINTEVPENFLFSFKEQEGLTVVLHRQEADTSGIYYTVIFSWITLKVHSSLEAVGLTAAFSSALAKAGISCNVVAAYYHDHIFIPARDAAHTMQVLQSLSSEAA